MMNKKHISANTMIKKAENILLITHLRPDGDAVGSTCAMAEYLKNIGKRYSIFCQDSPAEKFGYLNCIKNFISTDFGTDGSKRSAVDINSYDLLVVLDCGSVSRTALAKNILGRKPGVKIIEFDHHPKVDDYADLEIRSTEASSTSELVYDFFKINQVEISREMAAAILTGISTDTANFLHTNTSDKTIKISSEMMNRGARLPKIVERTYRDKNIDSMRIWGKVMSGLKVNNKYNFAVAALIHDDIKDFQLNNEILDGISNFLSNLKGVKATIFLRELEEGFIRGSIRTSDPGVDVSRLAETLGGGGHPKAAGFTLKGRLVETDYGWKVI